MKSAELSFENEPREILTLTDQEVRVAQGISARLVFDAFRRKSEEVRAKQFIQEVTPALNPQYGWIADIEPCVLRDTFEDIATAREKIAQENGKSPLDWHVYRHFRATVETEETRERDMRTVLLLEALMNGDVRNGTLPALPVIYF